MNDVILKRGLWVVVADGEKALLLKNEGDAKFPDFQLVQEMVQDNPATREQGAERPGRYSNGPSPHNSAFAETDWHRLSKERFADDIAERLYKLAHEGKFDALILSPRHGCWAKCARSCTRKCSTGSAPKSRRR